MRTWKRQAVGTDHATNLISCSVEAPVDKCNGASWSPVLARDSGSQAGLLGSTLIIKRGHAFERPAMPFWWLTIPQTVHPSVYSLC